MGVEFFKGDNSSFEGQTGFSWVELRVGVCEIKAVMRSTGGKREPEVAVKVAVIQYAEYSRKGGQPDKARKVKPQSPSNASLRSH